jgi:hypothetical protein
MNASLAHNIVKATAPRTNSLRWPGKQLRRDTDRMLRDIAYVLQLTRRVKEQIAIQPPTS